jgi:hypothetical protein
MATAKTAAKKPAAKKAAFKIPKTLGACADLLYTTREERLALQKQIDELAERESMLKEHVINNLPKSNATGVSGKVANVRVETKTIPQVQDWEKFYQYISKNKAFDLLQRRVNDKAIQERWEAKKTVAGVGTFDVVKVSCTKV